MIRRSRPPRSHSGRVHSRTSHATRCCLAPVKACQPPLSLAVLAVSSSPYAPMPPRRAPCWVYPCSILVWYMFCFLPVSGLVLVHRAVRPVDGAPLGIGLGRCYTPSEVVFSPHGRGRIDGAARRVSPPVLCPIDSRCAPEPCHPVGSLNVSAAIRLARKPLWSQRVSSLGTAEASRARISDAVCFPTVVPIRRACIPRRNPR